MLAGSIFDLEPATEYECRFVLTDTDGVDGTAEQIVAVRTRSEPQPSANGRVYHVYPPGYEGPKEEPAFTGLLDAYYTGVRIGLLQRFNVMAANYNYFEGLTIRNTELAFWGGYKNLTGSSGLTI